MQAHAPHPDFKGADQLPAPFDILSAQLRKAAPEAGEASPLTDPEADARHLWSPEEVLAITQAWASGRPLLVRGEAGCGKSQLAKALAECLGVPLYQEVIHPRFEATDLLYKEDHVGRLAAAQILGAIGAGAAKDAAGTRKYVETELAVDKFVKPGVLMSAYREVVKPGHVDEALWPRAVVLLDEIDKADADLPNALLGVLGDRRFKVPGHDKPVECEAGHRPLIVITTNEDRELPAAFVRRCAVLNIRPPADEAGFVAWMEARARVHVHLARLDAPVSSDDKASHSSLLLSAARQVWQDRAEAVKAHLPTVGLAEYIDLLYAVYNVAQGDPKVAETWVTRLSAFALVKHKEQDQSRAPRPLAD